MSALILPDITSSLTCAHAALWHDGEEHPLNILPLETDGKWQMALSTVTA